jgi:N-acetylmuramoyl-L-alanine amidase
LANKLFLDFGHGGKDSGAVGNGLYEKDITLEVGKKLAESLRKNYKDVEVMESRTDDTYLSLAERTKKANTWKADILISIHVNSAIRNTARGFESHIYTNVSARTKAFQNVLHAEIMKSISADNITDRGKLQSNFHMLRESACVAVLTENLFINNPADSALLKKEEFINKLVEGHENGIVKFLGLKRSLPPPPAVDDTLFQVIAGTFSDRENAEQLLKNLKARGFEAYINQK